MKHLFLFIIGITFFAAHSQKGDQAFYISPELFLGKTAPANTKFPQTNVQSALFLSLGTYNLDTSQDWVVRLGFPKTGVALGYTDLGNSEFIGQSFTVLPYAEFGLFRRTTDRWYLNAGLGAAYINKKFNFESNTFNRATATSVNWAFRSFIHYNFLQGKQLNWRVGLGYSHTSNGHTKLPNQGLNSFLASISAVIDTGDKPIFYPERPDLGEHRATYITSRFGLGFNVLNRLFNTTKAVYTLSFSADRVVNKTFKYGGGFYMRYYQQFYDYIKEERGIINTLYPHFKESPFKYALNFGFFGSAELLLGHFGLEMDIGLNVYKPFYKVEWQISQTNFFIQGNTKPAPLDDYYEIKRTVSSRLGLKYYFINTNRSPTHNIFIAGHINGNLGQADFTEVSLGYMHKLN